MTSLDRATHARMQYARMLLRGYSRKMGAATELVAAFEQKLARPRESQEQTLQAILEANRETEYGRRYGFAELESYPQFCSVVPVVEYEELRSDIERMLAGAEDVLVAGTPSYFSTTSGSTAAPKFIPGTQQTIRAGCEAILIRNALLQRDHPQAFDGRALFVVGSVAEGKSKSGASTGAMTGFGYYAGQIGFPGEPFPYGVFTLEDYATRYHYILRLALAEENLSALMVYNPSTLVLLFEKAAEHWDRLIDQIEQGGFDPDLEVPAALRGELAPALEPNPERAQVLRGLRTAGPRAWWPGLTVLVCWKGGSVGFYLTELERWLGDLPVRDLGVLASEVIATVPIDDGPSGGVLLPDAAFFEFVPLEAPPSAALPAWQLKVGERYRLLITTKGGLYRYDLGDIVRVERHHHRMPVLTFLHRAGRTHSFTGEKLTERQVTQAVEVAAGALGVRLAGFTAVPVWSRPPHYEAWVELARAVAAERLGELPERIDRELAKLNIEYAAKRKSGRLQAVTVVRVASGTFADLRRQGGVSDAQYKQTHLTRELEFGAGLEVVERIA